MRQIGTLDDPQQAQRFADYLLTLGIKTNIDRGADGAAIWIRDEDHLGEARTELDQFLAAPDDDRYVAAGREARQVRAQAEAVAKRYQKNQIDVRRRWTGATAGRRGRLTMVLIGISVAVALLSNFGKPGPVTQYSMISQSQFRPGAPWHVHLQEIQQGQLWRLVTPIFLHLSPLHLVFNMLWLYQLGNLIEARRGWLRYGGLVVAIAVVSDLAQYAWSGPGFGGMSGVVYGLFGYIWMKARYDPAAGFYLHPNTVFWLMGWFVLCLTGMVGPVANMAHGVGLAVGVIFGIAPLLWRK